jgi:putative phosphoribosyl transferase
VAEAAGTNGRAAGRYADRPDARTPLAGALSAYAGRDDVLVLALPRGGVEVGFEVARVLGCPLDIVVVRKIGLPGREELAVGAVATGGVLVVDAEVARSYGIDSHSLAGLRERAVAELDRREREYRAERPALPVAGKIAIVVDDGLATGSTMLAAVKALREQGPRSIVVGVPVGPPSVCRRLATVADEVICVQTPEQLWAVGSWYLDFHQTGDDEVRELLREALTAGRQAGEGGRQ